MKIVFLSFFTQLGSIFWPQQAQIWDSLNRILIFNPLERQKSYINTNYVTLGLTNNSKNLQNNRFLLFLTKNGRQKFSFNFLQMWYFLLFWSSVSTQ